ncbi:GrpB family protein [Rudaea sp.]|uniref:GrpB family protein n=1 Tax=Rudaea sp. TaxID=2136325 RepID=UPI00322077FA
MSQAGRKTIRIADYDADWPHAFLRESRRLHGALGGTVLKVHHIGSTSVHGLSAKPVIDILLEVVSLDELDAKEAALIALGYQARGEHGIPGRRYYQLGGAARTHQVHAFVQGDANVERHLAFRDYLRENRHVAEQYARIKMSAAEGDATMYCAKKEAFIKQHERIALMGRKAE